MGKIYFIVACSFLIGLFLNADEANLTGGGPGPLLMGGDGPRRGTFNPGTDRTHAPGGDTGGGTTTPGSGGDGPGRGDYELSDEISPQTKAKLFAWASTNMDSPEIKNFVEAAKKSMIEKGFAAADLIVDEVKLDKLGQIKISIKATDRKVAELLADDVLNKKRIQKKAAGDFVTELESKAQELGKSYTSDSMFIYRDHPQSVGGTTTLLDFTILPGATAGANAPTKAEALQLIKATLRKPN